jgi:hypothetical protein
METEYNRVRRILPCSTRVVTAAVGDKYLSHVAYVVAYRVEDDLRRYVRTTTRCVERLKDVQPASDEQDILVGSATTMSIHETFTDI